MSLVDNLIQQGWLKTPRIIKAFQEIERKDFLPNDLKHLFEFNEALPIAKNQTISQPLVVAFMLEQLSPEPQEKILDIGSGSGWTSVLLAHIVSQNKNSKKNGKVIAVELIPELKKFGEENASKYDFIKQGTLKFICADGSKGYKEEAPFDKILVSAEAKELVLSWREQLKIGGKIVVPINNSIWVFQKNNKKEFSEKEYPDFVFVPFIADKKTD